MSEKAVMRMGTVENNQSVHGAHLVLELTGPSPRATVELYLCATEVAENFIPEEHAPDMAGMFFVESDGTCQPINVVVPPTSFDVFLASREGQALEGPGRLLVYGYSIGQRFGKGRPPTIRRPGKLDGPLVHLLTPDHPLCFSFGV
jgi:hypothetical protein